MLSLAEARWDTGQRSVVANVPKQRVACGRLDLAQVVTVSLIDRRVLLFLLLSGVRRWAIHAVAMVAAAALWPFVHCLGDGTSTLSRRYAQWAYR